MLSHAQAVARARRPSRPPRDRVDLAMCQIGPSGLMYRSGAERGPAASMSSSRPRAEASTCDGAPNDGMIDASRAASSPAAWSVSSTPIARTRPSSAWVHGQNPGAPSTSMHVPHATRAPWLVASATAARSSDVLPIPASPATRMVAGSPSDSRPSRAARRASCGPRPTNSGAGPSDVTGTIIAPTAVIASGDVPDRIFRSVPRFWRPFSRTPSARRRG
jgi:hypothetical protein